MLGTASRGAAGAAISLLALGGALLIASPASADTTTITYTLEDGVSPTSAHPEPTGLGGCATMSTGSDYGYVLTDMAVTASGTYYFDDLGSFPTTMDATVVVYTAFDAGDPSADCVISLDGGETVDLVAGTEYQLLLSSYNESVWGDFEVSFDGPGTLATGTRTATSLAVLPGEIEEGETATLTATIPGAGSTGDVEFFADGDSLGTAAVVDGAAQLDVAPPAGDYALTARFSGTDVLLFSTSTEVPLLVTAVAAEEDDAELAETGVDGVGFAGLGAVLTLGGVALVAYAVRRRNARDES